MELSETGAIITSLVLGGILTILFDNIFVITFIGFISTYIVKRESKSFAIGITAAILFGILNFFGGIILSPQMPEYIAERIGFDFGNFILGFLVTCTLSGILGFIGVFIAEKTYKRIYPDQFKDHQDENELISF